MSVLFSVPTVTNGMLCLLLLAGADVRSGYIPQPGPLMVGRRVDRVVDAEVASGQRGETQTNLAPGQYLVLVGVGEGEPTLASTFKVTPAKAPAALPAPEATVRSIECGFRGPRTLPDGELVRFENEGFLVHMDLAFPVKNMNVAQKAVKYLLAGKEKVVERLISGPPVGFAGPLSHGAYQQEIVNAKPGIYVQVCFMETQDGRDHTLLGMERIIKIVK